MDFDIEQILNNADPVLSVRQVTTVDTTALIGILRQLGRKIEEQDAVIQEMQNEIEFLKRDNQLFQANAAEYGRLKNDVAGLIEDVESITMYAKLPKVPNRARDGLLRSYIPEDNTSVNEPLPQTPSEVSRQAPNGRNIVVATQMTPVSAGISRTGSRQPPTPNIPQQGRPRTGLTMEADPDTRSLRVTDVKANSAAAEAGLRPGDFILYAEGNQTITTADFISVLDEKRVGDVLQVQYSRDGVNKTTGLKLKGKQPSYTEDS